MIRCRQVLVALTAVAVLGSSGCASGGVETSADTSANGTVSAGKTASATANSAPARVGSTITVKGNASGSQVKVTLVKVAPSAKGGQFDQPTGGNRYAAAQFRIQNTGTAPYDDSPTNGAKLIDPIGQQFSSTIVSKISAGPLFGASVKVAPGGTALGWVAFEVPKNTKISSVQFGMDSGFADTAEWKV